MKVFYADGERTGSPTTIDFEDWEPTARARNIVVLWPDGSLVDDENESRFDDHVTLMPTRDPAFPGYLHQYVKRPGHSVHRAGGAGQSLEQVNLEGRRRCQA
jgi:hypothetical protein